jgi:hypothetical protein
MCIPEGVRGRFIRERVELHQVIVQIDAIENMWRLTAEAIDRMLERFHTRKDYQASGAACLCGGRRSDEADV